LPPRERFRTLGSERCGDGAQRNDGGESANGRHILLRI
jgi:hypothetical protein